MQKTRKKKHIVLKLFLIVLSLVLVALLAGAAYILTHFETEADLSLFERRLNDSTTRLYYYNEGIDREYAEADLCEFSESVKGEKKIRYCPLSEMPENLKNALIAIEDKRFLKHRGVDLYRTAGAAANYLLHFDSRFGGSTITQQVVKNATGQNDVSISRKLQEMLYAIDVEKKMSKDEILEIYLNLIHLSHGCYGVGAASRVYFSKEPSELTLPECACLAAITNSPTYYDPIRNPENNRERASLVLCEMYKQGYIGALDYLNAVAHPAMLNVSEAELETEVNSWYADMVVEDVIADLCEAYGYSRATASDMVYGGGLRIVTAMNPYVQRLLESYYADVKHFGKQNGKRAQSGMIVIEPHSGDILGVVGSVGEKSANRIQSYATSAKRPSGSTIKPLSVYAPALERGLATYASIYDDVPVKFVIGKKGKLTAWPHNANLVYNGLVNVNYALKNSLNTVALRVLDDVGIENSFDFLKNTLGIESLIEYERTESGKGVTDKVPAALALGQMSYGVTLREMTAAYTVFPNGGVYSGSRSYIKVYDSMGRELLSKESEQRRAIGSANACIMTKMLENVIKSGTASPVHLDERIAVAGKTGTTQDSKDRWFIAYTPYCLCGVWYGYEYPETIASDQRNTYLKIWDDVMTSLHVDYLMPQGGRRRFLMDKDVVAVTYCKDSGCLLSPACYLDPRGARTETGYFVRGTEPHSYCHAHILVDYDAENGGVACEFCDPGQIRRVGLLNHRRSFPIEVTVTDAQYIYRAMPRDVSPSADPRKPYFAPLIRAGDYCGRSVSEQPFNHLCPLHGTGEWVLPNEEEETEPYFE